MSLMQCGKCGCVDNSATSEFGARWKWTMGEHPDRHKLAKVAGYETFEEAPEELCCVCSPVYFKDGSYDFEPTVKHEWHGSFERKFWPKGSLTTDQVGNIARVDGKPFYWDSGKTEEIHGQSDSGDQQGDV